MQGLASQDADRNIIGRKSESAQQKSSKKGKGRTEVPAESGKRGQFSKSSALFGMLQDRREGKEVAASGKPDKAGGRASASWKL